LGGFITCYERFVIIQWLGWKTLVIRLRVVRALVGRLVCPRICGHKSSIWYRWNVQAYTHPISRSYPFFPTVLCVLLSLILSCIASSTLTTVNFNTFFLHRYYQQTSGREFLLRVSTLTTVNFNTFFLHRYYQQTSGREFLLCVSYLEIYNEVYNLSELEKCFTL
jgi:hypothetical protein